MVIGGLEQLKVKNFDVKLSELRNLRLVISDRVRSKKRRNN